MRIEKLSLKNFRGFEELEIDFPEGEGGLAVFIGVNGSGKSSILDGLYFHLVDLLDILVLEYKDDFRVGIFEDADYEESINANSNSTESNLGFYVDGNNYETTFLINRNSPKIRRSNFKKTDELRGIVNLDKGFPIVGFYQTNRKIASNISLKAKDINSLHLMDSLQLSVNETIDFNYFFEWFRNTEDFENEQRLYKDSNYRHAGLEVFRKILTTFLVGYENPRVRRQPTEKLILEKGRNLLSITQLSHGEKLIFAIIGDIIRRISITQPNLKNPLEGKGVILIDEIEQHLHPSWQRTIIPNLRKTFPNIQFIVTTHSPQVLSNVPRENVFILEDFKLVEKTPHTYGKDTNSILHDLFGITSRPAHAKKEFKQLYRLLDDPKKEDEAIKMLKEMEKKYGKNDPDLMEAKLNFEFMTQ